MRILLIGGHRNGDRIECEGDPHIRFPVSCRADAPLLPTKFEEYRKERLRGKAAEFSVYVSTSITIDDALRMMIENYSA